MNEERTPQQPPLILPVAANTARPVWSVMIPVYNCIKYLESCLLSVVSQEIESMQIEVVDDGSIDGDVETLVKTVGKGRVAYFRQPANRGSLRNFETCINRSKGKYIHILHGDDLVYPGFYLEIQSLFEQFPTAGAAFTDYMYLDEAGNEMYCEDKRLLPQPGIMPNWLQTISLGQRVQPPAMVVKREVYEKLGSFYAVHYGEDWEMWCRIAANYPVAHSPRLIAGYRIHGDNITSRSLKSGQNIHDIATVIAIIKNYLPGNQQATITNQARKNYAIYFARVSDRIYHELYDPDAAWRQAKAALKLSLNRQTVYYALKILCKKLTRYKYKSLENH